MKRDEIIRMAREAGGVITPLNRNPIDVLERFAALVAEAEREACAQIAEQYEEGSGAHDVIRARGQKEPG